MEVTVSFPEPVATGGMVEGPGQADTRLSRAGESGELVDTMWRRLYLKAIVYRGLGPRRHGAVAAPHRQGSVFQWLKPSKLSMPYLSCGAPVYRTQEASTIPELW
jgi:hypothetical protein